MKLVSAALTKQDLIGALVPIYCFLFVIALKALIDLFKEQ